MLIIMITFRQFVKTCLPLEIPQMFKLNSCNTSFSLRCMSCRSLFVLLYFFFWPLCCLFFFYIWIRQTVITIYLYKVRFPGYINVGSAKTAIDHQLRFCILTFCLCIVVFINNLYDLHS